MTLRFHVPGTPVPQGSKRHVGGGRMIEASKSLRPWRDTITWEARHARGNAEPITTPVRLELVFTFPHPKHHYRTGRYAQELKPTAPVYHTVKPDCSKLCRAVEDALVTAGVIKDDSLIAELHAVKLYPATANAGAGVTITVSEAIGGHLQLASHARLVDELYVERYA